MTYNYNRKKSISKSYRQKKDKKGYQNDFWFLYKIISSFVNLHFDNLFNCSKNAGLADTPSFFGDGTRTRSSSANSPI